MDIVYTALEAHPFHRAGPHAEYAAAIPKAMRSLEHRVTLVTLLTTEVEPARHALARRLARLEIPWRGGTAQVEIHETRLPSGVQAVLLSLPGVTDRPETDRNTLGVLLSRAAHAWLRAAGRRADVVHAMGWRTAPLLALLSAQPMTTSTPARVLSLTDAGRDFDDEDLPDDLAGSDAVLAEACTFEGRWTFASAAARAADATVVASHGRARELLDPRRHPRLAAGLSGLERPLFVVPAGIDHSLWNPATDPYVVAHFDAHDPSPRARCKSDLLLHTTLEPWPSAPLFAFVGSLDRAHGADLLLATAARLMRQDLQLLVVGDGPLAADIRALAVRFPERVGMRGTEDPSFVHRVFSGADFLLTPRADDAETEHVLGALRYGAVPVVLDGDVVREYVVDCDPTYASGTAFVFGTADEEGLGGAVGRALGAYLDPPALGRVQRRGMRRDSSWERSARQLDGLYSDLRPSAETGDAASAG